MKKKKILKTIDAIIESDNLFLIKQYLQKIHMGLTEEIKSKKPKDKQLIEKIEKLEKENERLKRLIV